VTRFLWLRRASACRQSRVARNMNVLTALALPGTA